MTDLANELALLHEERRAVADTIRDNVDPAGDVADEAEARSRLEALDRLDHRIEELTRLHDERRRNPRPSTDQVNVGTEVTLSFDDGTTDTIEVVQHILETSAGEPAVTPESPLGRALIGARVGDRVSYQAPVGPTEVEVVEIAIPSTGNAA